MLKLLLKNSSRLLPLVALLGTAQLTRAQSVGIGTSTPAASAVLDISSTSQGLLLPRLTVAQRQAIASPAQGLLVQQTDGTAGLYYYSGVVWVNLRDGRVPDATGSTNRGVLSLVASGAGSGTSLNLPVGLAVDGSGTVYVASQGNHCIHKISPAGLVSTLAGSAGFSGYANGTGTAARFSYPSGVAVDGAGTVYVADQANNCIRKITPAGVVSTLAGSRTPGSADGPVATASFSSPTSVALDATGTLYVTDFDNHRIRKITPAGVVSTLAGSGSLGSTDGPGATASFNNPSGVAVDGVGTVYVTDQGNNLLRKVTATGVVSTLAGSGGTGAADGLGAAASFNTPTGVAVDAGGTLYVADGYNNRVRKVTPAGLVTTLAGPGTGAGFNFADGVAVDAGGTLYVADQGNNRVVIIK